MIIHLLIPLFLYIAKLMMAILDLCVAKLVVSRRLSVGRQTVKRSTTNALKRHSPSSVLSSLAIENIIQNNSNNFVVFLDKF